MRLPGSKGRSARAVRAVGYPRLQRFSGGDGQDVVNGKSHLLQYVLIKGGYFFNLLRSKDFPFRLHNRRAPLSQSPFHRLHGFILRQIFDDREYPGFMLDKFLQHEAALPFLKTKNPCRNRCLDRGFYKYKTPVEALHFNRVEPFYLFFLSLIRTPVFSSPPPNLTLFTDARYPFFCTVMR